MHLVRPSNRIGWVVPPALAAGLMVLAVGCGAFNLPSISKATPAPATSSATWQRSSDEIHGLPVLGENIGVEVGKHVPPFSLGLADGSIITSEELLDTSQPAFLFFWATT